MSGIAQELRDFIEARDHALMRTVHRWRAPRWVRVWMLAASRCGDGWLWFAIGFILALYGGAAGLRTAAQSCVAGGLGVTLFLKLKRATGRRRPCTLEPHCWATLLPPDQFSFPSGHTISAFAISVPIVAQYPDAAPGLCFISASIAASRIVLGMHFLSDVLAGGVIGVVLAVISMTYIN